MRALLQTRWAKKTVAMFETCLFRTFIQLHSTLINKNKCSAFCPSRKTTSPFYIDAGIILPTTDRAGAPTALSIKRFSSKILIHDECYADISVKSAFVTPHNGQTHVSGIS